MQNSLGTDVIQGCLQPTVQTNQIEESFSVIIYAYHTNRIDVPSWMRRFWATFASRREKELGYEELKPEQEQAIKEFVLGRDVLVALPTAYGKSLCYCCLPYVFDKLRRAWYETVHRRGCEPSCSADERPGRFVLVERETYMLSTSLAEPRLLILRENRPGTDS